MNGIYDITCSGGLTGEQVSPLNNLMLTHLSFEYTKSQRLQSTRCNACDKFVCCIVTNFNCMENSIPLIFTFCRLTHTQTHIFHDKKVHGALFKIRIYTHGRLCLYDVHIVHVWVGCCHRRHGHRSNCINDSLRFCIMYTRVNVESILKWEQLINNNYNSCL